MDVRQLMSSPPHTCRPNTDLAEVTRIMWDHDCGFVPVVDASGHAVGVVTDRDVCVATATRRLRPEHIAASEVMAKPIHACLPDDSIDEALAAMKEAKVRRLPVIDATGHVQGVLSLNDIVRAVGRKGGPSATAVVKAMAAICAPRAPVAAS